jgi:hypothetical protein
MVYTSVKSRNASSTSGRQGDGSDGVFAGAGNFSNLVKGQVRCAQHIHQEVEEQDDWLN